MKTKQKSVFFKSTLFLSSSQFCHFPWFCLFFDGCSCRCCSKSVHLCDGGLPTWKRLRELDDDCNGHNSNFPEMSWFACAAARNRLPMAVRWPCTVQRKCNVIVRACNDANLCDLTSKNKTTMHKNQHERIVFHRATCIPPTTSIYNSFGEPSAHTD